MRKLLLITLAFLFSLGIAFAQSGGTVTSIGYTQDIKQIQVDSRTQMVVGISGGGLIGGINMVGAVETINQERVDVMEGFPAIVKYFPQVFDEKFFASKGYFSNMVQLQWDASSNNIEQFRIYRKPINDPGDSLLIAVLGPGEFFYKDELIDFGVVYKYTIFAKGVSDNLREYLVNYIEGDGFAFPSGAVSGQVKFQGGTAVKDVSVLATTDGDLSGQGIDLKQNGEFLKVIHGPDDDELELRDGFTVQMWAKYEGSGDAILFSKGENYNLKYNGSRFNLQVGDANLDLNFINPIDSFFHIAATYNPGGQLTLQAFVTDNRKGSATGAAGSQPAISYDNIAFGGTGEANGQFIGKIDEIRLWDKALSQEQINNNYSRYIAGSESGIIGYWRLDMGIGSVAYDFARKGSTFWENHGELAGGADFTDEIPLQSQLAFRGLTNSEGNYTITGFPFESVGSLYKFTPLKPFHEFDPAQQTRFVGPSQSIHNEVNFTDVSSFEVSGTVKYKDSDFPVQGVSILIDGQPAIDADGLLILTDNLGRFTVDVPIGEHSIRMSMANHTFEYNGRFPAPTPQNAAPLFNFQEPINGLEFIDNTLIKVAGRVVGGPVQAEKVLGFGRSENNIGNATITLTTQKGFDIADQLRNENYSESHAGKEISSSVTLNTTNVTVRPNSESGEFVFYLPPEQYQVTNIGAGSYIFDDSFNVTLDLRQTFAEQFETVNDTLATSHKGVPIDGVTPLNINDYSELKTFVRNDTLFTVGIDTFSLQKRQDFIYRVTPTIEVKSKEMNDVFGEKEFVYENKALNIKESIKLYDASNDKYLFHHPIFKQRNVYDFNIELFEEYVNEDNGGVIDRVPVIDGRIDVQNELSLSNATTTLQLNSEGKTVYSFRAGQPNRTKDAITPENSFTKTMTITAFSGNNGAIRTVWREGDPFRGIVFGSQPFGNNFVTTGPNVVDYILRDPPGSNSYSSLTKGETITKNSSFALTDETSISDNLNLSLGLGTTTFVGLGAGVINEVDDHASIEAGYTTTSTYTEAKETEETLTIERTISTSSDPLFVGESGDIFIGKSTNIVYGAAAFLELIPVGDCTDCGETEVQGYKIGVKNGLNFGSQFNTGFAFSQFYIENTLVPNLKEIRNSLLTYVADPNSIQPTTDPVYVSKIAASNPKFGTSNTNKAVWGASASSYTNDGPSYVIKFPADYSGSKSDTIAYYNKQIDSWEYWLAENEKQKVQASLLENISFESGANYEQSITSIRSETSTLEVDFTIEGSVAIEAGITVNDLGITRTMTVGLSASSSRSSATTEEKSTTAAFVLSDENIGDAYTIDVKKPKDGFGPVFSTRGGQTACPYEPETKTRYFQPGKHLLNAATQRREGPVITADEAVLTNIPDNRAAQFVVNLSTDSETDEAFNYTLMVDPITNPNGAAISVNGSDIGDGFSFLVKPGQTIRQTITIEQGRPDVFEYENLRFMLISQCQFDPSEPQLDISDTVHLSAYFVPGCSEIEISDPGDNWILNSNAPKSDTLLVTLGGYDLNMSDFTRFQFQYRAVGTDNYTTDMTFYNSRNVTQAEFAAAQEPKMLINASSIVYPFDMSSLPDQEYEIRAVAYCDVGPGLTYQTPSDVLRGVKDTQRPQLFGAPQPADGILSANDEILIRFNETIVGGKLTPSNFSVKGVLNNAPVRNSTSVNLDGVNNYVRIEDGLRLGNSSFTVEFKLKRNSINEEVVIFSKGYIPSDRLEIGFTAENKLFVQIGDQKIASSVSVTDVVNFNHYAITYNAENNELFAYVNSNYLLEQVELDELISGDGPISLGKSNITNDRFVDGNFLDLRVWNRFKSLSDVFASIGTKLNGIEVGLVGYWPFDEAFGTLASDRARFRNATLFAEWTVLPEGYAYSFDGVDDYVSINTGSTVTIGNETDFTIEMWMNGAAKQTNAVLFSSGRGLSGTEEQNRFEDPARSLSLGFNAKGEMIVATNGQIIVLESNTEGLLDNNWHHIALSVSRSGSAIFYLDGEQVSSFSSDVFGGFYRDVMTLGARTTRESLTSDVQDRFFKGMIDEFRIWNVARTGTNLILDRNSRLNGNEFGLRAYYPFDEYVTVAGIQLLNETLKDQFINADGPNGGTATAIGGADFTTETPNITLTRPVKDVPFTFVVNDDELIITPSPSSKSSIERSILEISVRNIEDVNGNRLASPISFTAFVNRNLVKWGDEAISIEKAPNNSYQFEVEVVNLGGNMERFNISNVPPWLKAEPRSGTLDPQSTTKVKFTINPGLNNGYYNEDIFLTTDFGFNEKLNLDVKVLEPAPDWEVNPSGFEFSMGIVATLNVGGIVSRDGNDLIAAFVDNELRGMAQLEYVPEFDTYMAFMDIYSNKANGTSPIEFRAFDADEGIEYRRLAPISPLFESNATIGRPSAPQELSTGELRSESYNFAPGFSWVSFNLNSAMLDNTNQLLAGVSASTNDRVTAPGVIDVYTEGLGWLGTITNNGGYRTDTYYLVSLKNGGVIDLIGTNVDAQTALNIMPGFNRISFIPDFNLTVNEAFASVSPVDGDIVRGQFAFAVYEDGLGWIGSLKNLEPGKGYLYYSNGTAAKTFSYPRNTVLSSQAAPDEALNQQVYDYENPWQIDGHAYPLNMSVIAELDVELPASYVISAFDKEGFLLGTVEAQEVRGKTLFYLTVYGNNEEKEISFKAFDRETGKYYQVNESSSYKVNEMIGSRQEPLLLTIDESFDPIARSTASPNPFIESVTITLGNATNALQYEITDINGVRVGFAELVGDKKIRSISWDGRDGSGRKTPAGLYILRIVQQGNVEVLKLLKQDR